MKQLSKEMMLITNNFTNNYLYFELFLPLYCPSLLVFTTFKMSINPQFQGHDQYDVMKGSVSAHFAEIDNVLLRNECINGQYQVVTQACYGANTPVDSPGLHVMEQILPLILQDLLLYVSVLMDHYLQIWKIHILLQRLNIT